MKHSVKLFLEVLKEATLDMQDDKPTKQFKHGVNETIAMAKEWFESNNVDYIKINPNED